MDLRRVAARLPPESGPAPDSLPAAGSLPPAPECSAAAAPARAPPTPPSRTASSCNRRRPISSPFTRSSTVRRADGSASARLTVWARSRSRISSSPSPFPAAPNPQSEHREFLPEQASPLNRSPRRSTPNPDSTNDRVKNSRTSLSCSTTRIRMPFLSPRKDCNHEQGVAPNKFVLRPSEAQFLAEVHPTIGDGIAHLHRMGPVARRSIARRPADDDSGAQG